MRPAFTSIRYARAGSLFMLLVAAVPTQRATALAEPAPPHRMPHHRTVADVLVVRTRVGMQSSQLQHLFATNGAQEVGRIEALNAAIIRVPHGRRAAVQRLLRRSGYFTSVEPDPVAAAAQLPNDPGFDQEWGLAKIGAPAAWNLTMGSTDVTVAVVDSGIDSSHADLRDQVIGGIDLVNNDNDPSDDNGHGTRMAGVIAAEADNGVGIAGVAPHCKLMPVKVLGNDGTGAYSTIINGITYAADHNARVINLSLAGTVLSDAMQSAVDYAAARGAVVVAASGNYGTSQPTYPAACSNVVAVGATDQSDGVASFSNFGAWLSLTAPGISIATTNWNAAGDTPYVSSSGTSPAAAFVSGVFALVFSAHPELSANAVANIITSSAHDIGSAGWDPYAGWGRVDGAAALGADSLGGPTPPTPGPSPGIQDRKAPSVSIFSPANNSLVYGNANIDVIAADDIGVTSVELMVDKRVVATASAPPFGFVWNTQSSTGGKHKLTARAYDAAGHRKVSRPIHVEVTNGVGLAVSHARLSVPPRATGGSLSVSGKFALPDGLALDQVPNTFSATLNGPNGVVVATAAQSNVLVADARGRMRLTATSADNASGKIKILVTRPKSHPTYNLTLTATGVNVANANSLMNLTLNVNGAILSQSIAFRSRKTTYMFP